MNVKILIFLLPMVVITTQRVIPEVTANPARIEASSSKIDLELQPGPLEFLDVTNSSNKDNTTNVAIKRRSVEEDENEMQTSSIELFKDLSEFADFSDLKNTSNEDNATNAAVAIKRRSVGEDEEEENEKKKETQKEFDTRVKQLVKDLSEFADFAVRLWRFLGSLISQDNFYLLRNILTYVSRMSDVMANFMPEHPQDEGLTMQDIATSSKPPLSAVEVEPVVDYYSIQENLIPEDRSSGGGVNDARLDKITELRLRFVDHLGYLPQVLEGYFGPTKFTGIATNPPKYHL